MPASLPVVPPLRALRVLHVEDSESDAGLVQRALVRGGFAIEALRVESSGVVRIEKGNLYRLTVALRNLERHEVALPAFELSLTDTRGQLIARRVVRAAEFGVRAESIGSSAELMLQATIQVGTGTVAGYTIELFYP